MVHLNDCFRLFCAPEPHGENFTILFHLFFQELERHIENLQKNHRHELGIERARHKETKAQLKDLADRQDQIAMQLRVNKFDSNHFLPSLSLITHQSLLISHTWSIYDPDYKKR